MGNDITVDSETGFLIELLPGEEAVEIIDGYYDGNESEITKGQYDEMIHSYFGTAELQSCIGEWYEKMDLLGTLEQLMY